MVATSGHFPEALLQKNEHRTEPWTTQPGRGEAAEGQTCQVPRAALALTPAQLYG